jgi:hypothetical protein
MRFDFTYPRDYEIKVLESAPPVHPVEKLHHYPVELEEGDRSGVYARIVPSGGPAWFGFFAAGFDSPQVMNAVCSCPDPGSVCVVAGGYAYIVNSSDPGHWFRIEQRPVIELKAVTEQQLILFSGFTCITALGPQGVAWTTERLSWEGIRISAVRAGTLQGFGWDALTDKEAPFEVDLKTGKHTGGASPGRRDRDPH